MMTPERPPITVVLNTYNRAERLRSAVPAVLNQSWPSRLDPFELIVVDDGSSDQTQQVLSTFRDQRLRCVSRENGGLSAARNTGLAECRGEHVVFLDDDDDPAPQWLARLTALVRDNGAGIASCGARILGSDGTTEIRLPTNLGAPFDHVTGNFLAGCFVARSDLVRAAGGYLEGLPSNHQTELALRLVPKCREWDLPVVATREVLLTVNRSDPDTRRGLGPVARPRHGEPLYRATLMILARHEERISRSPELLFRYLTIAGVAAMRAGEARRARHLFVRALRLRPWSGKTWIRLGASSFAPLATRLWGLDHHRQDAASQGGED